jgi:predicted deacylase
MFGLPPLFSRGPIRMVPVGLGARTVRVPVFDMAGARPGKTLLVTGGADGDEYAGMEAAYALIAKYAGGDFAGRLVVVPVLNVPGFEAECSQNPMDGKFPKMVGLGKPGGSPTERLMHWLASEYAGSADAWMDLHGGAITEGVRPFVWLFESGSRENDLLAQAYARGCGADTALFERVGAGSKAGELARRGCCYVLAESGARGGRDASDAARHMDWTEAMMRALGMVAGGIAPRDGVTVLRRAHYANAPFAGIWRPFGISPDDIARGQPVGACVRLDGSGKTTLYAPASGVALWWKETMSMREGDALMVVGSGSY